MQLVSDRKRGEIALPEKAMRHRGQADGNYCKGSIPSCWNFLTGYAKLVPRLFTALLPPHPGPLPWGEGGLPAAVWRTERAGSCGCLGLESRSARCQWERRPT